MQQTGAFLDREDAGHHLAERLMQYAELTPIVYGLSRGGIPVAYEVARSLDAPLDIIIVRKLRHPLSSEIAIGAIREGAEDHPIISQDRPSMTGVSQTYLNEEIAYQRGEITRQRKICASSRRFIKSTGRVATLVDDGMATGHTMTAAVVAMRLQKPFRIIVAVPVASIGAFAALKDEADDIVCLHMPDHFGLVGAFYRDFHPVEEQMVVALLNQSRDFGAGDQASPKKEAGTSRGIRG